MFLKDKKTGLPSSKAIVFDKVQSQDSSTDKTLMKRMEKNLQLNNFINALLTGYLKLKTTTFLIGSTKWEERFVVLTNIGLLYFENPNNPPIDLFPVLDCEIKDLDKTKEKGTSFAF